MFTRNEKALYNKVTGRRGRKKMKVSFEKLFKLMEEKNVKKFDLRKKGINPKTVAALMKNENVNTSTIAQICEILKCTPNDIMEIKED